MCAHCKKVLLTLLFIFLTGDLCLAAASVRWIHLGTINAGMVDMAINGKIAYRKMPAGKATPWGTVPPGLHHFQIGTRKNPGPTFELEITDTQKITIVSVSDDDGNIQSRTFGLESPQGNLFVLNAMPGTMMSLPETKQKAIFGKGFWVPEDTARWTVSLADSEGFEGEVDFTLETDSAQGPYLAIVSLGEDGKPSLAIMRDRDSYCEISSESVVIPDELTAGIRVISERNVPPPGSFDPDQVRWDEVESQIFWLNLGIERGSCRLVIRGFPAMRRLPSGRGSGFVKWPAGNWSTEVVAERTNKMIATDSFILDAKGSVGLISSGGGQHPHHLLTLEGRSRDESDSSKKSRIRFVNALPDGVVRAALPFKQEPVVVTMKPGEVSEIVYLEKGGFPGITLDLTVANTKNRIIGKIPRAASMPLGDWVVVVRLDEETFAAPVLTWVEMDKGSITVPITSIEVE